MRTKSILIAFVLFVLHTQAQINFQTIYYGSGFGVAGMAVSGSQTVIMDVIDSNNRNVLLTSVDMYGNVQWCYDYGDSSLDEGRSIISTSDGGYLITGISMTPGTNDHTAMVLKVDSAGTIQWQKAFGDTLKLEATGAIQLSDNGYVILSRDSSFVHDKIYLLRMDSTGNSVWMKEFDDIVELNPVKIIKLNGSDDFYVAGDRKIGGTFHPFVTRMDGFGNIIWSEHIPMPNQTNPTYYRLTAAAVAADNRLYISCYNHLFFLIEMDESGVVLHIQENGYGDACNFHNKVTNILPLSNGLVLCTANLLCSAGDLDYLAYFDSSGNGVSGLSSSFYNLQQALLTIDQDFNFLQKIDVLGTPFVKLTKSNLTLSNSCYSPLYLPFLQVPDTVTAINFTFSQSSFSGVYALLFTQSNDTLVPVILCQNNCRVASLFEHPDMFDGYVCINTPVTFRNFSFNASSYQWYVDSLPVSSGPNLNYTFSNTGFYHVSLVAADSLCSDSTGMVIEVRDNPVASFTVVHIGGTTFRFYLAQNVYTHYVLEYGDGTSDSGVVMPSNLQVYPGPGTYQACLYAWNHCGMDSTCQTIVITSTGISEISSSGKITVSPNPFHDHSLFSFSNASNSSFTLKILDATGQAILDKKISSDHFLLERNSLSAGIYLVMLFDGNNQIISTKKFIIN